MCISCIRRVGILAIIFPSLVAIEMILPTSVSYGGQIYRCTLALSRRRM